MFWLAEIFNGSHSQQEMHRLEQWAHRQRAEAFHGLALGIGGGLRNGLKTSVGLFGNTAIGLSRAYRGLRRWQRRRVSIRELNALSDRTLSDIGLARGDIPSVVDAMIERGNQPVARSAAQPTLQSVQAVREPATRDTGESDWQRAA